MTSYNLKGGTPVILAHTLIHGLLVYAKYILLTRYCQTALFCQVDADIYIFICVLQRECSGVILCLQLCVLAIQIARSEEHTSELQSQR